MAVNLTDDLTTKMCRNKDSVDWTGHWGFVLLPVLLQQSHDVPLNGGNYYMKWQNGFWIYGNILLLELTGESIRLSVLGAGSISY